MLKTATNMYDIVDLMYYPAKICGIAPFTKVYDENNNRRYVVSPPGIQHLLYNGGISVFIMATCAVRMLNQVINTYISVIDFIVGAVYLLFNIFSVVTILIFVFEQESFINCLKIIHKIDKLFDKINLPYSYKLFHFVALFMWFVIIPVYLLIVSTPLWEVMQILSDEPFGSYNCINILSQLINLAPAFIVRHIPLYFYTCTLLLASRRLDALNKYIRKLERYRPKDFELVNDTISTFMEVHNLCFHLIEEITIVFSIPILCNVSITFCELITLVVTLKFTTILTMHQGVLGFMIYGIELIVLLSVCQMLKIQIKQTRRIESELTLPYFNAELSNKRKLLLQQMLHEKILIHASGCYELDMAVITVHMGLISTVLMFLLKLRQDLLGQ